MVDFEDNELKEIFNIFRAESEEIIERLNSALLALEKTPDDKDLITVLFRDAHSIKGAARMVGFSQTQRIAHSLEDILGLAKDNQLILTHEIADTLYKSVDLIAKIVEQSIDKEKEIYLEKEVTEQVNLLENIKNQKSEIQDIENTITKEFNKEEFVSKIDRINYLIIDSLICIIKLTDNIEEGSIIKLLKSITELTEYFEKINDFEIKNELETIKLKLDIIVKCHSELTNQELEEIQGRTDTILTILTKLCEVNNLDVVDYYGFAFEGKNIVEEKHYDFDEMRQKLASASVSNEKIPDIISDIENLIENFGNEKFVPMLKKIKDLFELINKVGTTIEESQLEIITNSLSYCYSCINNETPSEDLSLLEQQITVVKQLIEIANPIETTETQIVASKANNTVVTENVKDFSKLLSSGEIKTLHVESSKLDAMVNQIGELISAKIKATKQLSELSQIEKQLEECQKDFTKILNNFKAYEHKRTQNTEYNHDNSANIFVKQFINSFAEQNKKLAEIANSYNKYLRSNTDNDTKMRTLIDDFDGMIKNIRILPLATVFHLFGRMVRDIARERGKEIEFTITGSETSADKKIVEEIKNPLIHIIRNSIDHGIETPEKRIQLGKSPTGHLQINAKHLDNKILIEVIDDGQGFNVQKIKDKAIQKGFLTKEELESMDDNEVINIVFLPGFTTGEEVTSISGRGVGMDVVKSKIAQLNGTVKVISEFNKGSKIQIEIPVTVATMSAFLIQTANQTFAIPVSVINTVTCRRDDEIIENHSTMTILHNGKNIPVYNLSDLLQINDNTDSSEFKTIIILETNNKIIGIIVDKLLGEQEILHKKLSPPIYRLKNISGITTLASGETCLILNVIDLINSAVFQNSKIKMSHRKVLKDKKLIAGYKNILFVDDSITSRTLGKNVLSSYGFKVQTAENPIKALKMLDKNHFDLIISDIEMPGMSGLEFLLELKSNEMFADIPFIIMSSLGDETTIKQAQKLGAKSFIIKSQFNKETLIKNVSDVIFEND